MKTSFKSLILICACIASLLFSCKKEWDAPPVRPVPVGGIKNIDSLRAWVDKNGKQPYQVNVDASVYLTITADEASGNIYKEVYAVDAYNRAICIKLLSGGGLYQGDSIRLNLNGSTVDYGNEQLQIDSVDVTKQVIKMAVGKNVAPTVVTIAQLDTTYESKLIQINNVEFSDKYKGKTYADVVNKLSTSYTLHDCSANKLKTAVAYTSSYANFASQVIPSANGSIIAIAKRYNDQIELIFRNYSEIKLTNTPCGDAVDSLYETFNEATGGTIDEETVGGWTNYMKQGSRAWEFYTSAPGSATNPCAATDYSSTDPRNEMWLITPPINNSATKYLSFKNATRYNTNSTIQLFLLISTNFDGVNVSSATWTPITTDQITTLSSFYQTQSIPFNQASPFNGNTNILNNYNGKFHIAFKFVSNKTDSLGSYYIDNVKIGN
jgi:hypothetical protein